MTRSSADMVKEVLSPAMFMDGGVSVVATPFFFTIGDELKGENPSCGAKGRRPQEALFVGGI